MKKKKFCNTSKVLTTAHPMPFYFSRNNADLAIPYLARYKRMLENSMYSLRMENFCRYVYTSSDTLFYAAPYFEFRPCIFYAIYMCDDYRINNPFITIAKSAYEYYFNKMVIRSDFIVRYGYHFRYSPSYFDTNLSHYVSRLEALRSEILPLLELEMDKEKAEEIVDRLYFGEFSLNWFKGLKNEKLIILLCSELVDIFVK